MPTGSELRDRFREPGRGGPPLDAAEIIRRARRRRRPRLIAAGAGALLIVAVVAVPVAGLGLSTGGGQAGSEAGGRPAATGSASGTRDPAAPAGGARAESSACGTLFSATPGSPVRASVSADPTAVGAAITGAFALDTAGGERTVRIAEPIAITVLRGDEVVGEGRADLGSTVATVRAGAGARLGFTVPITSCRDGGALPAGDYRIVASLLLAPDNPGDASGAVRVDGEGDLRIG